MKKVLVVPFLAAIACAPLSSFGQSPAPAASDTPASGSHEGGGTAILTPEEKSTLDDARKKAEQDPTVQAARAKMLEARKGVRDAMVAKDPSLAPLLDKIQAAMSTGGPRPELTSDERDQLSTAHDAIKGTAADDAWKNASVDYRDALRKAMIAADPSIAAIFAKMPQGGMGRGPGGGGPSR